MQAIPSTSQGNLHEIGSELTDFALSIDFPPSSFSALSRNRKMSSEAAAEAVADSKNPPGEEYEEIREQVRLL